MRFLISALVFQFVQRNIGYSPEEVIAASSSSDPSRELEMKSRMKKFQEFLANFEVRKLL